jgi:chemotaxis protein methyltransferase CheR
MTAKSKKILNPLIHRPDGLTDKEFRLFKELIYEHTGISLSEHKRALVYSRLGKRLRILGLHNYMEYYNHILEQDADGQELVEMINAITTNKTSFFREEYHFTYLKNELFPLLKRQAQNNYSRNINIWSAGCSTGEEPYTIAMALAEYFPENSGLKVNILATDIDTNVLKKASDGVYPMEHSSQIPKSLLLKYFNKGSGDNSGYFRATDRLRNMITFQKLNLLAASWPHKCKFDIIFCRNVIIYFDKATQHKLVQRFQDNLTQDGHLMLGHSESLHGHNTSLTNIGKNIYRNATH